MSSGFESDSLICEFSICLSKKIIDDFIFQYGKENEKSSSPEVSPVKTNISESTRFETNEDNEILDSNDFQDGGLVSRAETIVKNQPIEQDI